MVPHDLVRKIEDYYKFLWGSGVDSDDRQVLKDLPSSLQAEVAVEMNSSLVERCPIFQGLKPAATYELIYAFKRKCFLPHDTIIRIGELGDEMFLLHRGFVRVYGKLRQT